MRLGLWIGACALGTTLASPAAAQGSPQDDADLSDLTIEQLIRLRDHGVTPEWAKRQNDRGTRLTVDELVRRRDRGGDSER